MPQSGSRTQGETPPHAETPRTRDIPTPTSFSEVPPVDALANPTLLPAEQPQNLLAFLLSTSILAVIFSIIMTRLALVPMREALEKQKQFVADASHELKTPLSLMSSEIQLFIEQHKESVPSLLHTQTFTQHLLSDVQRLTAITNDMLQLVKIDAQSKKLSGETINLESIHTYLTTLTEKMARRYPSHHLEFITEITSPISLYAAAKDMMQVVEILVENACVHTPANTDVELTQKIVAGHYQLQITDNGQGIAAEHMEKLFIRFYQVDSPHKTHGTGLGLPIAKKLIERWDGKLLVASECEAGTTFTIVLPLKKLSYYSHHGVGIV